VTPRAPYRRLSGPTPAKRELGKGDPDRLPDAVVCYTDTTIAMPLLTTTPCAAQTAQSRRLYDQRARMMKALTREYFAHTK